MTFTASQIALLVNGKVEGDPNVTVTSFGKIEEARPGEIAFLSNLKYEEFLYTTNASVVVVNNSCELKKAVKATLIRVPDAYSAFAFILRYYQEMLGGQLKGIEQPSYIAPTAVLGKDIFIGAFSYIAENVKIGDKTKIYPNVYVGNNTKLGENCIIQPGVKIHHDCIIGNRVNIHAGSVIGSDGFGHAPDADGSYKKIPQIGNVIIEDDVEIGANTTIDRATMGSTVIKSGVKLDNLIQIGHNAEVGSNTVIAAQAGISGSTKIGNHVMIGGQAGLVGHIQIADGSKINAQSGVSKSIKTPDTNVTGSPAHEVISALRSQSIARNLPEMEKRLRELEELVKKLLQEK